MEANIIEPIAPRPEPDDSPWEQVGQRHVRIRSEEGEVVQRQMWSVLGGWVDYYLKPVEEARS